MPWLDLFASGLNFNIDFFSEKEDFKSLNLFL